MRNYLCKDFNKDKRVLKTDSKVPSGFFLILLSNISSRGFQYDLEGFQR